MKTTTSSGKLIGALMVLSVAGHLANAQDNLTLFKLEKWDPRGLVESTRVHIVADKKGFVRLYGEGGNIDKEGKRWGQPAELVRVAAPTQKSETGKLTWLGPRHKFIAEPRLSVPWGRVNFFESLPGGEHVLHGKGIVFGFKFSSDELYPLTFKFVCGSGYVYMCGKGKITTPDGKEINLGETDKIEKWLKLLSDEERIARERASQALGYLTKPEDKKRTAVVKALSEALLTDTAMEVRRNSAQSLGRIGDKTALDALSKVKQEEHKWVHIVVQEAVGRLSREAH